MHSQDCIGTAIHLPAGVARRFHFPAGRVWLKFVVIALTRFEAGLQPGLGGQKTMEAGPGMALSPHINGSSRS
jgi:hypothetical protein